MSIKSRIHLLRGDIVNFKGDAIVNAANNELLHGKGVCGSIFNAAGSYALTCECQKLAPVITGGAVITDACNLKPNIKTIIHAVGPIFKGFDISEPFLKDAYLNSLKVLVNNNLKTIAFPCISTGIYGYPLYEASKTALSTCIEFLRSNDDVEITFYMYEEEQYLIYSQLINDLGDF